MSRVNVVSVLDHGRVFSQAESFPIKLLCAVSLETGVEDTVSLGSSWTEPYNISSGGCVCVCGWWQ